MRLLNNADARTRLTLLAREAPADQRSGLSALLERISLEPDAVGLLARSVLDDL
jgi:hypothetical protein